MTPVPEQQPATLPYPATLGAALEELLRFGSELLRAGHTAFRVRQLMGVLAHSMGFETLSVHVTLHSITASASRGGESVTLVTEVGTPGVNTSRIHALEELVRTSPVGMTPAELATKLAAITSTPPYFSVAQIGAAVGISCGAFAFLNGGTGSDVVAAAIGGGAGQCLRSLLLRRRYNQYATFALCALFASGTYCLVTTGSTYAGLGLVRHFAGFISSVLFLVPGFPLVAALLDLLQHQTVTALTRFAYGMMLTLAAAFGLSVVISLIGMDVEPATPLELGLPLKFALRAIASFAAGWGFAILYNSPARTAAAVGLLALAGNELRLGLHDAGMQLPSATFFGALAVGLIASLLAPRLKQPRIALTVPGIIIMVPGAYAFKTLVLFNQGEMLEAMQAGSLAGFVVGAMAIGLAAARFLSEREWAVES